MLYQNMFLFISGPEIGFVIFIVVLLFGADKIPEFARGLGKGINNIKHATNEIKQEINNSSYYSKSSINFKNFKIDLNKTAFEVHNELRAFTFKHYQLPIVNQKQIISSKILKSKSELKPGKIINRNQKYLKISTIDYNLLLKIK